MTTASVRLLSIAPYRILPATTGGHLGIVSMHDALGRLCADDVIGTTSNGPADGYSFRLHPMLPPSPVHYLPYYRIGALTKLGRELGSTHIFCDHPYMGPTAAALARRLKIPWFLRAHNIESQRFRELGKPWWKIMHGFERFLMRRADGVFFITPEDRQWAIDHYRIRPEASHLAPYGTVFAAPPAPDSGAKQAVAAQYGLDPAVQWYYFIGVQSYRPNADAVRHIVTEVWPRLKDQGFRCRILIGGKGLPEDIQSLIGQTDGGVKYMGFIEDLDAFIKACDVMINPVVSGGGIKTKAVEALGYNKIVVSSENGAAGILPASCGDNLLVSADGDWDTFAANCVAASGRAPAIPAQFFADYYWGAIAEGVLRIMTGKKLVG